MRRGQIVVADENDMTNEIVGETAEELISGLASTKFGAKTEIEPSFEKLSMDKNLPLGGSFPPPPPAIEESQSKTLEEAANLLLSLLDSSLRDYALELADLTLKIPRWQLLLGAMISQYQSGNLQSPSIDPSWQAGRMIIRQSYCVCKQCQRPFEPKKFGQLYCSNDCGSKARLVDIQRIREERAKQVAFEKELIKQQARGAVG